MNYEDLNNQIEQILDSDSEGIEALALRKMLEYGVFTLKERAIVNIRDGLKPVHKRFLYAMKGINLMPNTAHKKCARIVGDTIGKYHPHGDSSVYNALVGYSQSFNKNLPLVDGEGNFGSIDGDEAAAYRYTEARLSKIGALFFQDFDKKLVPMRPNFDDTEIEPAYLPAPFPNLVINGAYGIAVGMVTDIPQHNPIEVLNAMRYIIAQKMAQKDISPDKILSFIPAPDFPTGGIIYNTESMKEAIIKGTGKMRLRAKMNIEKLPRNKTAIIITELPHQVKKAPLVEKIGFLVRNKDIEGVTKLRDDTSKDKISIYIELKAEVNPHLIWNTLLKNTDLEKTISYNCLVIDEADEPKVVGIQHMMESFVAFRKEVIENKFNFIKNRALKKLEILEGIILALIRIDDVVRIIKGSAEEDLAIKGLISEIGLNVRQAKAILELKLHKLIGKEVLKVEKDVEEQRAIIDHASEILSSDNKQYEVILEETKEIRKLMAIKRRTEISNENLELASEDIVPEEELLISYTHKGYIRKDSLDNKNKKEMELQYDDSIIEQFIAHSHNTITFITNKAKSYNIMAHEITDAPKGKFIAQNMFDFEKDEEIISILNTNDDEKDNHFLLVTSKGYLKRCLISELTDNFRRSGLTAGKLIEGESLFYASKCSDEENIVLLGSNLKIIKFEAAEVSTFGRNSRGVTGIKDVESLLFAACVKNDDDSLIACLTEKSLLKPVLINTIKTQKRAGKGVNFEPSKNISKYIYLNNKNLCLKDSEKISSLAFDRIHKAASKNVGIGSQKMNKEYIVFECYENLNNTNEGDQNE